MGLDMYLYLRKSEYRSNASYRKEAVAPRDFYPKELGEFADEISERNFQSVEEKVDYQIGYWRKFNALHAHIVNRYANGVDECQDIVLGLDDIDEIIETLKEVNANHTEAEDLLPTSEGFFFGSLEYDEWYFKDVEYSIGLFEEAKKFLEEHKGEDYKDPEWELVYRASW